MDDEYNTIDVCQVKGKNKDDLLYHAAYNAHCLVDSCRVFYNLRIHDIIYNLLKE